MTISTKQDVIDRISDSLAIGRFSVSNGSSEPREFLLAVADQLGLLAEARQLDKPGIGQLILNAHGRKWQSDYDSRGSTITKVGLEAIEDLVRDIASR